jgi:hypothetical protein
MVFVDDEDLDRVLRYGPWYIDKETRYVVHKSYNDFWLLQRFILNYDGPLVVDHHPDKCTLNNQKCNLRIVEVWQNNLPKPGDTFVHNTSGVNGVHHNKSTGKYEVYASVNNRKRHLGCYDTLEETREQRVNFDRAVIFDPSLRSFPEIRANNTSGVIGVSWVSRTGKWKAKINQRHLGFFNLFDEAVKARKEAETGV